MKCLFVVMILMLTACSNKFDTCMDEEREQYRTKHPSAKHSELTANHKKFESMCSEFVEK